MAIRPYSIQSPEDIAKEFGGNKQKIAQAMQMGLIDPTEGTLAGMFIDRMRAAAQQEAAPAPTTVAQDTFIPPMPQGGGLGAMPQAAPPMPAQMGPQMSPQGMPPAQGGLGGLDFAAAPMAEGGIVGYAAGDPVDASTMEGIYDFYLGGLEEEGERRRKEQEEFLEGRRQKQIMDALLGNSPEAMRRARANLQQAAQSPPPSPPSPPSPQESPSGGSGTLNMLAPATTVADISDATSILDEMTSPEMVATARANLRQAAEEPVSETVTGALSTVVPAEQRARRLPTTTEGGVPLETEEVTKEVVASEEPRGPRYGTAGTSEEMRAIIEGIYSPDRTQRDRAVAYYENILSEDEQKRIRDRTLGMALAQLGADLMRTRGSFGEALGTAVSNTIPKLQEAMEGDRKKVTEALEALGRAEGLNNAESRDMAGLILSGMNAFGQFEEKLLDREQREKLAKLGFKYDFDKLIRTLAANRQIAGIRANATIEAARERGLTPNYSDLLKYTIPPGGTVLRFDKDGKLIS